MAGPSLTIKEIARLAGVSIGTVDRVLHNRGRVSSENLERVQKIIQETGYKPNLFASRLSAGQAQIAVVLPRFDQDFGYWELCRQGMEKACIELEPYGISVRFWTFDRFNSESIEKVFETVKNLSFDGIAVAPIREDIFSDFAQSLDPKMPLVFFDTDLKINRSRCFIGQDPYQAGLLAGRLTDMAMAGKGIPAMILFEETDLHLRERCRGFEDYFALKNRPEPRKLIQNFRLTPGQRAQDVERFLTNNPDVKSFFVPNVLVGAYADCVWGLPLVGYDLTLENADLLRKAKISALISQRPQSMGYESIRRIYRHLVVKDLLQDRIVMPLDVLFPENVDFVTD